MPFIKALPEWKNAGTKPPQSKIDAGWLIGEKPVAAWWNWHLYNTYYALQELQLNAVHNEKLGAASGVATLGSDGKLTAAQLPAIGSAQITDGSITNNDLATDVKVGSLATLTTTAKTTVVAAVNELKTSTDAKIPLTQRAAANGVATLDGSSKVPIVQMPVLPTANIADGSITDAKLATDNKVGSLAALLTTSKGSVVLAINEVDTDVTNHVGDATRHISAAERTAWNAAQLKKLTESNGYSISISNADLNTVKDTGFYYGSTMTNGPAGLTTGWVLNHAVSANYLVQEFVVNTNIAAGNRKFWRVFFNGTWNDWLEVSTTADAQARVDAHAADATKHITAAERNTWNAKASTAVATTTTNGLQSAADKTKLDGISPGANKVLNTANNGEISIDGVAAQVYTHPTTHPATIITTDANNRFVSDTEKASYAAKETPTGAQAKADNAVSTAKNYVNSLGLGTSGQTVAGNDVNSAMESGIYFTSAGTLNIPSGESYGKILNMTRDSSQPKQHVFQMFFSLSSGKVYTRKSLDNNVTWTAWEQLATTAPATGSAAGLMSAADFTKLAGIATNANNYVHPTGDGNSHVPATGTTNSGKFLKAAGTANSASWQLIDWNDVNNKPSTFAPSAHGHVIADVTGLQAALDGKSATTHTHADATTSASGFQSAADKTKLNGISTGANKTTNNATNGSISIDGTAITVYTHPATHDAAMIVENATKRFVSDTEKNTWNAKASTALATASANGLMSGADFSKLAGISAGANKVTNPATNGVITIDGQNATVYAHPTGDGNSHVPATGTTSNNKVLKAGSGANSASWQTLAISDVSGLQTALDAPQQFKLTQDNGSGKVITQTDLNQVLAPGTYNVPAGSSLLNRPFNSTDLAILIVAGQDTTGNTVQKFINLENDWVGKTYTRVCRGGTWTDWKQELQTGDAQMFKLVNDNGQTTSISGYDLNGLNWSGFFYGNNLINNPSGSTIYHRVWNMMSDSGSGVQMAMTNGGSMYMRFMTGGSWSQWFIIYTPTTIQTGQLTVTPAGANVPTAVKITFPTPFKQVPIVQVTAITTVPGTSVTGVAAANVTTTDFMLYVTRTSTSSNTGVGWTAVNPG